MIAGIEQSEINEDIFSSLTTLQNTDDQHNSTELTHIHPTSQILLTIKPPIHMPEAGLNPLVDAAAYIFSLMGKLRQTKHHNDLEKLHAELVHEIENFRETVHSDSYKNEYLLEYSLISCYALSATLDNIISNTTWGNQGKWEPYNLVDSMNQQSLSHENILIILERLVCDPGIYIDVMEFMYICLTLGLTFKKRNHLSEFSNEQLEQITYSLYKRIRAYRGNYSKVLSPFTLNPPTPKPTQPNLKIKTKWLGMLLLASFFAFFVTEGKLWLDQHNTAAIQTDFDIK